MRTVERCALQTHAVQRTLNNGICFRVRTALAVIVDDQTPDFGAVGDVARSAIVAGRENAMIARYDATDGEARAGPARGHRARNLHEVLIPTRTRYGAHPGYFVAGRFVACKSGNFGRTPEEGAAARLG